MSTAGLWGTTPTDNERLTWGGVARPRCSRYAASSGAGEPVPTPGSACRINVVSSSMARLTDFEISVLDFERVLRKDLNAKHEAIWKTFAVSPTRYLGFLESIIKKDAALEHDPLLVRRLRQLRAARVTDWRATLRLRSRDDRET